MFKSITIKRSLTNIENLFVSHSKPGTKVATRPLTRFNNIFNGRNQIGSSLYSTATAQSNMSFPCIDKIESRQVELKKSLKLQEDLFTHVVNGYETFHYKKPFAMSHGGILPSFKIAYETWGELNSTKTNAILIHTGLSASSHAKSGEKNTKPGWWENFIGPGLSIDTNKYFVICTNLLGGCYGSTGPSSINELTGKRYASSFPIITINDMVRAQFLLLDNLGISKLHASVGASIGGMQSLAAAVIFPERVGKLVSISACAISHPYSVSLRFAQRQVLMTDPNFNRGNYYDSVPPHVGMKLARVISTVSYRSGPEWEMRFGRSRLSPDSDPALCPDFLVETYLDHKGEKFCLEYDANSLLYISKAADMFDVSESMTKKLSSKLNIAQRKIMAMESNSDNSVIDVCGFPNPAELKSKNNKNNETKIQIEEDLIAGVKNVMMPTLVLGVQSDILFPSEQQKEIATILRKAGNQSVTYYELDSLYGHDTFLLDLVNVGAAIKGHLEHN
ncbi:hypothetical protein BB558_003762 [Smittium angustum]|uniref:AB hydrolase-1 domain-containing protein n=1 Tax=Smittium angustum TaxID=133377 RepID=A0A2U1J522_SMIAN|nr:hypothetical protein BB558_003762 [Smittium angustum]